MSNNFEVTLRGSLEPLDESGALGQRSCQEQLESFHEAITEAITHAENRGFHHRLWEIAGVVIDSSTCRHTEAGKFVYYVLLELRNSGVSVERLISDRELDFVGDIAPYYERRLKLQFDDDNGITLLDDAEIEEHKFEEVQE